MRNVLLYTFNPDFEADDGGYYVFSDTNNGDRYGVHKQGTAQSNAMAILMNSVTIATIALATYQNCWKVGATNVLVVSSTTGRTNAWLNNIQILTNDNTAWSSSNPSNLYVGASYTGGSTFSGTMKAVRVWQKELTWMQVADLQLRELKQTNDI